MEFQNSETQNSPKLGNLHEPLKYPMAIAHKAFDINTSKSFLNEQTQSFLLATVRLTEQNVS